jgi:hypothetical protein
MSSPTGLRLELSTRLAPSATASVGALLAPFGYGGQRWPSRLKTRLTLTAEAHRLDLLSNTPLGPEVSLASGPAGRFWIQHDARVFIAIPDQQPSGAASGAGPSVKRSAAGTSKPEDPESSAGGYLTATLTDPASGRSVRITAEPNPKWRIPELAGPLLDALLGGAGGDLPPGLDRHAWAGQLAEAGLPGRIRIEEVGTDGESALLSETRVTRLEHLPLPAAEFGPPRGYRSWKPNRKDVDGPTGKPGAGETAAPTHPVDVASGSAGVRRKPSDGNDREVPDPPPPAPAPRPRAGVTHRPRIGFRLEQRLLNHVAGLFNAAITPIRTITIAQGEIVLDWLAQLRADVGSRGAAAPGTAIFQLLHDVTLPGPRQSPRPDPANDFGLFNCRGLIDQLALRDAEQRIRSGTYPATVVTTFNQSMRQTIAVAATNWDLLPDAVKARLAFELVRREYGVVRIPYPTGTTVDKPILGLLHVAVSDIAGTLTLPRAPATPSASPFNPLLTLTAGFGGTITGSLSLGTLSAQATVNRWPSPELGIMMAGAVLGSALVPGFGPLLATLGALSLFLSLDRVNASINATGLTAALTIRFIQDARGIFVPTVSCVLSGTVTFGWATVVPTGIHQILSAIEQGILGALRGTIMVAIADKIAAEVHGVLSRVLGAGFPATALRLGLPVSGGARGGVAGVYTYLEAELDPARNPRLAVTTVLTPAHLEAAQHADAVRAVPQLSADHYASLSFDENFLNMALSGMRLSGLLDWLWAGPGWDALKPLVPTPFPRTGVVRLRLRAESGPAMTLTTSVPPGAVSHGAVSVDYLLAFEEGDGRQLATVRFGVRALGQLVLASAVRPGDGWGPVDLRTLPSRAFDLLLAADGAVCTPVDASLTTTQEVRTVRIERNSAGKPQRFVDVELIDSEQAVPVTPALGAALAPLLRQVVTDAWSARRLQRSPRRDGVPAPASGPRIIDPVTELLYRLDGGDPDQVGDVPHARVAIGLERRLAHFHLGHGGMATLFLNPSAGVVPMIADATAASIAAVVLGGIRVQASSTSLRNLSL